MPYAPSKARKVFDEEAATIIQVVRDAHSTMCAISSVREYTLGAAVALCVAKLEVYVEDLVSDWITEINKMGVRSNLLPKNLRVLYFADNAIVTAFRNWIATGDERSFLDSLGKLVGNNTCKIVVDDGELPTLHPKRATSGKKYPSPDNINNLFYRLGIPNIFQSLNASAKADLRSTLVSFNDIRTAFAHQGQLVGISHGDVIARIRDIIKFVRHLDLVFYRHVTSCAGSKCWVV